MPATEVLFFQDERGDVPVRAWLVELEKSNPRAHAACVQRIERLAAVGHELRRPEADLLRDGIHELRARSGRVNYRLLYSFHGQHVAVLLHAVTKEDTVETQDIRRAIERRQMIEANPSNHIAED